MASNHKLTGLIRGRTIRSAQNQGDVLTIGFEDGSVMTVRTGGSTDRAVDGGTVKAVRQDDTTLHLDFEDGSTLAIPLAEAASSVMVRDKDHRLEYAD
jgi:hypothetical protein